MSKKKTQTRRPKQAEINIGMIGHVDHGKSTLVEAFTGKFPDTHSEELRRGISIRLGYGDVEFRKCSKCAPPEAYTTESVCTHCKGKTTLLRRVAFVDAPGHEVLMATMLSGAAIMDAAVLVISANESCPMPQTREHFAAMEITGITEKTLIAQNKVELMSEKEDIDNFKQISTFVKEEKGIKEKGFDSPIPIIPISAVHKANLDVLIQKIEENFPTPERDLNADPLMYVARSFDIIKPGQIPKEWSGGVVGGSIIQGKFAVGDEIEIRPGYERNGKWHTIKTKITSIQSGFGNLKHAIPGGLIGIGTDLDPVLTKNDRLVGHIVGVPEKMPPSWNAITFDINFIERVIGLDLKQVKEMRTGTRVLLNVGTAKTVGVVTGKIGKKGKPKISVKLDIPITAVKGTRVAISILANRRWRLIGWGNLFKGEEIDYT